MSSHRDIELVVIASSFGGLEANTYVLAHFPIDIGPAIILVTHLSENSEKNYAAVLEDKTAHQISIAKDKNIIESGHIYLAPGGYHLLIEDDKTFSLSVDDRVHNVRPSADVLFESLAYTYKDKVLGVVLTGANEDGARGLKVIAEQGGLCIVQSPESAVAETMPLAAVDTCPECIIVPIKQIPGKILDYLNC